MSISATRPLTPSPPVQNQSCVVIQGLVNAVIYGLNETSLTAWRNLVFPRAFPTLDGANAAPPPPATSGSSDGPLAAMRRSTSGEVSTKDGGGQQQQPPQRRPSASAAAAMGQARAVMMMMGGAEALGGGGGLGGRGGWISYSTSSLDMLPYGVGLAGVAATAAATAGDDDDEEESCGGSDGGGLDAAAVLRMQQFRFPSCAREAEVEEGHVDEEEFGGPTD